MSESKELRQVETIAVSSRYGELQAVGAVRAVPGAAGAADTSAPEQSGVASVAAGTAGSDCPGRKHRCRADGRLGDSPQRAG